MQNKPSPNQELYFMSLALEEARKAKFMGEVPIGAIIVHKNQIVGRGHNLREQNQDATAHAEVLAIQDACRTLKLAVMGLSIVCYC